MIRTLIGAFLVTYEIAAYFLKWPLVSQWRGPAAYLRDAWHAELGEHFRQESRR